MRYKILPHTADFRLKIYGKDIEELFINGAYGLAKIFCEEADKKAKFVRGFEKLEIKSVDTSALIVDFLNELLTLSNINKKIYPKVKVLKLSNTEIIAHASGVPVDGFDEDVKAVSYHGAEMEKTEKGFEITLTLDV